MNLFKKISKLTDRIELQWESAKGQALTGTMLVSGFVIGIILVDLNGRGLLPEPLKTLLPVKHLVVIELVLTLLLFFEVISLIFSFVHSVTTSMGKQFEVLSLVLLRDVFKEFSHFTEPLVWEQIKPFLFPMISSALGALAIFVILGFYYKLYHSQPITRDEKDKQSFIVAKKIIAFCLLVSFISIIVHDLWLYAFTGKPNQTFETFYTILVFSDILIMLVSMRYGSSYRMAFRNSGFAVATVLIRLALISPPPFNALIGTGSALFVLGVSLNYKYYTPSKYQEQKRQRIEEESARKSE
ncbi:MAG: hypothetical protein MJE63_12585 [Proteobacteria bacterium]|nr:hypothetical protein [Pseudomonadota bacterium]